MSTWKHYYLAFDVQDALTALASAQGPACVIAGGTDLLLDLQQGRHPVVDTLVDINSVGEMTVIEMRDNCLYVGAAVPLNRLVASSLIWEHAQALGEACSLIAGPQVRNTATLGGNVAHALPAADGSIALLALGARAKVACLQGSRLLPLEELYLGPGHSALQAGHELLVGFSLPIKGQQQASAFQRVMRPQGVALPVLNMAVWLWREEDEMIKDVRISIGPAGPKPLRARAAEEALRGERMSKAVVDTALKSLLGEVHFRTSPHRATAEYRQHLAGVLLAELMAVAWERAGRSMTL